MSLSEEQNGLNFKNSVVILECSQLFQLLKKEVFDLPVKSYTLSNYEINLLLHYICVTWWIFCC